jgi:hypothetical protein
MPLADGVAAAQERDLTASYDTRDVLGRFPHDVDELPSQEEAQGRAVTFDASLEGVYTSNAGSTRNDAIDTGYLTPGFGIDVTPVGVGGGWSIGGGALLDGDYYTGDYDEIFGEGRLEGFVFAQRGGGPGVITAEIIALGIFDNDFSEHDLTLLIGDLTYSVGYGNLSADIGADYEHADVPEVRRMRVTGTVAYTLPQPLFGHAIIIEGDAAFSDFTDGANSNRNDTVVGLLLLAERELAPGWSLEWEAAYVNRFSNRENARFEAFNLLVALGRRF